MSGVPAKLWGAHRPRCLPTTCFSFTCDKPQEIKTRVSLRSHLGPLTERDQDQPQTSCRAGCKCKCRLFAKKTIENFKMVTQSSEPARPPRCTPQAASGEFGTQVPRPRQGLPVLTVLGGQCPVQLLDHTAGGQRPVDGGGMRRPCGCGKLSSEGRVSVLPAGVLEEHSLAWGVRGQGEAEFTGREATGAKEPRGRRSLPGEPAHAGVAGAPPPGPGPTVH